MLMPLLRDLHRGDRRRRDRLHRGSRRWSRRAQLNPRACSSSGALGAAIGDQAYFYLFRGRLPRWMAKYPSLQQKAAPLSIACGATTR